MLTMKAILTLIIVIIFGAMALLQNSKNHDTVESIKMGVVLDSGTIVTRTYKKAEKADEKNVARLYEFKSYRVKWH